jgi:hypothetical protein
MKSVLYAIFTGALLCGISVAQDGTPPPSASEQQAPTRQAPSEEQAAQPPTSGQPSTNSANVPEATGVKRLAPGSVIPVQLAQSIDAKKVKTGEEVVAKVTQDLKTNSGEIIFPKDTKVLGHVTEAQQRSKEQKESLVGIAFDRAVLKNGSEMQVPMSIQAIIGPQNNNPNSGGGQPLEAAPPSTSAGRNPGMGGSSQPQVPSAEAGAQPSDAKTGKNANVPITAETQGVVGMPNLKLESTGANSSQGSVVTSEKNNVKLDSGTLLLLRVNQ